MSETPLLLSRRLPRPSLSDAERATILRLHHPKCHEWREVWDDALEDVYEKAIPLDVPVCYACAEPWGEAGCSTHRAIVLLGFIEDEKREVVRRNEALNDALLPRFGVSRLAEPGNNRVELSMWIDAYTLLRGNMELVDATLAKMRDHWRQWFKDIGDRERIAQDHTYALTLDSERYVYLTQTFDALAPYTHLPNTPWEVAAARAPGGRET